MTAKQWHVLTADEALDQVKSNRAGVTGGEARKRLEEHGHNELQQGKSKTLLMIFLEQFADLMIWVLIGAAVISGLVGEWIDTGIILMVVFLNAVFGAVQEARRSGLWKRSRQWRPLLPMCCGTAV